MATLCICYRSAGAAVLFPSRIISPRGFVMFVRRQTIEKTSNSPYQQSTRAIVSPCDTDRRRMRAGHRATGNLGNINGWYGKQFYGIVSLCGVVYSGVVFFWLVRGQEN